jgi:hypothetical protein
VNFTPHPTSEGLRIQASALHRIVTGRGEMIESLQRQLKEERAKKRPVSQDELESERAANARLTEELEKFQDFARDIRDNYDCDNDAHRYNTRCRCCEAEKLIGPKE